MRDDHPSLAGKLLIAMPTLADPNFWRSVVLLGAHSRDEGAFGLVVNRELDIPFEDILAELGQTSRLDALPAVGFGGPVEPGHGFILREVADVAEEEDDTMFVGEGIAVTGSTITLQRLVGGEIGGRFFLVLGYAGWYPGQLEKEIEENSWLIAPLTREILFDLPAAERWQAALASIGVDPGTLVDVGGGGEPS